MNALLPFGRACLSNARDGSEANEHHLGLELFVGLQNSESGLECAVFRIACFLCFDYFNNMVEERNRFGESKRREMNLRLAEFLSLHRYEVRRVATPNGECDGDYLYVSFGHIPDQTFHGDPATRKS